MAPNRRLLAAVFLLALGCGRWGFDDVAGRGDAGLGGDGGAGGDGDAGADPVLFSGPGTWESFTAPPELQATQWTRAAWTGSEFIAWGGALSGLVAVDTGARLNPTTGEFTAMSNANARVRHSYASTWTGTELFVYGGASGTNSLNGGDLYDPESDSWRSANSVDQPGARTYTIAVWTGSRVLVWGGWGSGHHDNGALYDPEADEWTPTSMTNAPSARSMHGAVLIDGGRVFIFGGCTTSFPGCGAPLNDGAIYDPATDTWTAISTAGAPSPRSEPGVVWNGREVIVWGGAEGDFNSQVTNTGGAYDPVTDTWRSISTDGAPSAGAAPGAVALGNSAVFYNGGSGAIYDPFADSWQPLSTMGIPGGRSRFGFASSGDQLFIWGGSLSSTDGFVWTPEP